MTRHPEDVQPGQIPYSPALKASSPVLLEIEREVLGCDYGATSWTDRAEAERFAGWLGLAPGVTALEIGAGSGWPGLLLAGASGARVTLTDRPGEVLRFATERAIRDGLATLCPVVQADGGALPFADASFDAVYHCDVLC